MTGIIEQLKREIEAYEGPIPAYGDTVEQIWFRLAVKQLHALEAAEQMPNQNSSRHNGS